MKTKRKFSAYQPKTPQSPFDRALKYLSYRPRSTKEMHGYLVKKGYSETDINAALKELTELHFLDDKDFARLFAESRQRKGKSKRTIAFELKLKGIDKEEAQDTLESTQSDFKTALEYMQKRLKQFDRFDPEEKKGKIISRLRMRGYNWDTISNVLKKIGI